MKTSPLNPLSTPTHHGPKARGDHRRRRLAFVVHDYTRHLGHSRYVVELASRFRRDHDVHVFTNSVNAHDTLGITFHHVRAWRPNALATILSFVIPATLKVRGEFDVVHAQGLCGLRHNVATAHLCQIGWFDALSRAGMKLTWRQEAFKLLVTGLEKRALTQAATRRVIAVSERVKAELAWAYGRTDGVEVIYHGTDTIAFHPGNRDRYRNKIRSEVGIQAGAFVALFVGDLKKGAVAAIQATAKVSGVTLLILSSSDAAPYRIVAQKANVADRVIFLPHSVHIERFFAAVDVFVFPTIYDSFGLGITEAMATGLPVVTSRTAGAAELITHGTDGLLTDLPWDVSAIAVHLERLRDDSMMRDRLGAAARSRVEQFTWDRTADQTMNVYQRMVLETP